CESFLSSVYWRWASACPGLSSAARFSHPRRWSSEFSGGDSPHALGTNHLRSPELSRRRESNRRWSRDDGSISLHSPSDLQRGMSVLLGSGPLSLIADVCRTRLPGARRCPRAN